MFNAHQYLWTNDNYNEFNSHFIASLIKKTENRKKKKFNKIWGDGTPKETNYVDDIADACIYFMNKKTEHSLINRYRT